jgi:transposase-like protein
MEIIRKEYKEEDKLTHIRHWLASGKLPSEYSKEVGLSYTTLRNWINKYHRKKVGNPTRVSDQLENKSSFLAIQIQPSASILESSSKPLMELVFCNGSRIHFHQTVSVDYLQQLLTLK